jgi:hypothetical protein
VHEVVAWLPAMPSAAADPLIGVWV